MDKGTSPQQQEECAGLCFSRGEGRTGPGGQGCAGLPPRYRWNTMQHVEGPGSVPGVPVPAQEGGGGSGRTCSHRTEKSSSKFVEKQVEAVLFLQGIIPGPCPAQDRRRTGIGALGEHPGEQALVLQHQGKRQHLRPHNSYGWRCWGETTYLVGAGTGPWCSSSLQLVRLRDAPSSLSLCAVRAVGAREEAVPRLPGWAHSGWGAQCFWAPESSPSLPCKAHPWASTTPPAEAGAGPCVLEGGDPWSKSRGLGTKAPPSNLRKGRTFLDCRYHHTFGTFCTQGQSKMRCTVRRQLQTAVPAVEGLAEGLREQKRRLKLQSSASPEPGESAPGQCKRMEQFTCFLQQETSSLSPLPLLHLGCPSPWPQFEL